MQNRAMIAFIKEADARVAAGRQASNARAAYVIYIDIYAVS